MFDGPTASAKTLKEIAAGVRLTAKHQVADAELRRGKTRLEAIAVEIRALNGRRSARQANNMFDTDHQIMALESEKAEIVDRLTPIRREVVEMRRGRAAQVRAALDPAIMDRAQRAIAALEQLRGALADLEEANLLLAQAYAEELFLLSPDLETLSGRLHRLAGKS